MNKRVLKKKVNEEGNQKMADNDIAISVSNRVPNGSTVMSKPSYLIYLEDYVGKTKTIKHFISTDKPEHLNGFIQVKGIFVDSSVPENDIIKNYVEILTSAKRELVLEVLFPWHKICYIRSLVFKAK